MGYKAVYSDPEQTTRAGFGKVAHLPFILDTRPGYHRLGSRYLIDRGLGLWMPIAKEPYFRTTAPTDRTIKNYADWLANFLEWTEIRGVDLLMCDYVDHVQGQYQNEMLDGSWSRDGLPLAPTTVNLRVQQACDFLTWMAAKGLRQPFDIATTTVRSSKASDSGMSSGHRSQQQEVRKGKVRAKKRKLRMPSDLQVRTWLDGVYKRSGYAMGLMCETALLSAARREEVACWRVDTLPEEKEEWRIGNPDAPLSEQRVMVTLKFGTKGPDYGKDHGDKVGPERDIWIPLALAERLDDYRRRKSGRHSALKRWIASAPDLVEQRRRISGAVHLFLDEETGERISGKKLYHAWTSSELPFKGWSPHFGRDWWACSTLWREVQKNEALRSSSRACNPHLDSAALAIIRLVIQPQLGHARDSTTMIYLQWLMDTLGSALSIDYEAELPDFSSLDQPHPEFVSTR